MMKDWSHLCTEYRGLWVALADDEETVIAAARDVPGVLALSAERGSSGPLLFRVPDEIVDFVGYEGAL
jgi:hypothetical protein